MICSDHNFTPVFGNPGVGWQRENMNVCVHSIGGGREEVPWEEKKGIPHPELSEVPFPACPFSAQYPESGRFFSSPSPHSVPLSSSPIWKQWQGGIWVSGVKDVGRCFRVRTGSWGVSDQVWLRFFTGLGMVWTALSCSAAAKGSPCLSQQREAVDEPLADHMNQENDKLTAEILWSFAKNTLPSPGNGQSRNRASCKQGSKY